MAEDAGGASDASPVDASRDAAASDGNVVTLDAADASPASDAGDASDAPDGSALQISARAASSCGVRGDAVACWGSDDDDVLGASATTGRSVAGVVTGLASGARSVAVGTSHACAVLADGGVVCWGSNTSGQLGSDAGAGPFAMPSSVALPGNAAARAVATSEDSSCALLEEGTVACWGNNSSGQLGAGDGAPTTSAAPIPVSGISHAMSLSAGELHFCAVLQDSTLTCWGWNHYGQIGTGDLTDQHAPFLVPGLPAIAAVATGDEHTCALATNGAVYCWGANDSGQLGDTTSTARMAPDLDLAAYSTGSGVTAISAGSVHTCATRSGAVYCWGNDTDGQLGNNMASGTLLAPPTIPVYGLAAPIRSLAAGGNHTCAIDGTGAAFCWGENTDGQVGDGATMDIPSTATSVIGW